MSSLSSNCRYNEAYQDAASRASSGNPRGFHSSSKTGSNQSEDYLPDSLACVINGLNSSWGKGPARRTGGYEPTFYPRGASMNSTPRASHALQGSSSGPSTAIVDIGSAGSSARPQASHGCAARSRCFFFSISSCNCLFWRRLRPVVIVFPP